MAMGQPSWHEQTAGQQTSTSTVRLGTTAVFKPGWCVHPVAAQFAALGAGGVAGISTPAAPIGAPRRRPRRSVASSVPSSWPSTRPARPPPQEKVSGHQAGVESANFATPEGANAAGANAALRGMPLVGGGGRGAQRTGNLGVRYGFRYSVLTRPPSAG